MREKINENQESINILKKNKRIGLVGAVSCIIIFFILLINRDLIHGLMLISYPILLGLSIFFGKIGLTGKIKDGLKYLCFILTLVLIIVFYFLIITIRHGFGPGLADFTYQINNECLLTRTSAHMIMIGCSNIEKSIGPEVTSLGWDDNYIVASTHPTSDENNAIIVPTPNSSITYWWILDLKIRLSMDRLILKQNIMPRKMN